MNKSITEIIDRCGGELLVAHNLILHQQTIKRWLQNGEIPEKYWKRLAEIGGISYEQIEKAHARPVAN